MAIIIRPDDWVSTTAYNTNDKVVYNGVGYEARANIAANSAGNTNPLEDTDNWQFFAIFEIVDYYSLQTAMAIEANTDDEEINESIPAAISDGEKTLSKFIRSPAQRVTRRFTVDSNSTFQLPSSIIEVEHLRHDVNSGGISRTLRERGAISIQKANRTTYEEIRQLYLADSGYTVYNYEYPVFYVDGRTVRIAPAFEENSEMLMTFIQKVPELGKTGLDTRLVNDVDTPINSAGQTSAEWVAAGNTANTFVQASRVVTTNLWTATLPQTLKAFALAELYRYLRNPQEEEIWIKRSRDLARLSVNEFKRFEASGPQNIRQDTPYCG